MILNRNKSRNIKIYKKPDVMCRYLVDHVHSWEGGETIKILYNVCKQKLKPSNVNQIIVKYSSRYQSHKGIIFLVKREIFILNLSYRTVKVSKVY